jgi:hypothetical protein
MADEVVDPHAGRRIQVSEKDLVHKDWNKEARAIKTVEEFVAFHDKLMNGFAHDYGTEIHALAALALAGACLGNHDPINGGISGAQAMGVMWQWLEGWGTGPRNMGRILDYEDMLYPQYGRKFKQLSATAWKFLQERAAAELAEDAKVVEGPEMGKDGARIKASPRSRNHWQSIVDGVVPFGWELEPTSEKEN